MNTTETDTRSPEEIERSIAARRESLKEKLHEIEQRLSPGERIRQVRERIDPEAFVPWAAVGAIATGTWLAARGLKRRHSNNGAVDEMDAVDEIVCLDVAVPTVVVP